MGPRVARSVGRPGVGPAHAGRPGRRHGPQRPRLGRPRGRRRDRRGGPVHGLPPARRSRPPRPDPRHPPRRPGGRHRRHRHDAPGRRLALAVGPARPVPRRRRTPWWGPWAIIATALGAATWLGFATGWGGAVGGAFTVLASGFGTYAFYRLTEVVAELHRTRAQLAAVAVREERQRMSRDLHDLLGHSLSLIVVKAEAVRRIGTDDPDAVVAHARDIEAIGRRALNQVRQAVAGYRGNGLADELANAEEALRAAGVRGVVDGPDPLPPAVAADATLGWVVREAVTNVLRRPRHRLPHRHRGRPRTGFGVDRGRRRRWRRRPRRLASEPLHRYARTHRTGPRGRRDGYRRHRAGAWSPGVRLGAAGGGDGRTPALIWPTHRPRHQRTAAAGAPAGPQSAEGRPRR